MYDELGTVTLLVVDQVDSTVQLRRLGDDAGRAIRAQLLDGLLLVVAQHRGALVDTAGDGLLAHFPSAALALAAARECLDLVAARNRSVPEVERCQLRAGVHTGEPLIDDAGRLHGMVVVFASRLCAAAAAGQVLASEVARTLVASRPGFEFGPAVSFEGKGIEGSVVAFPLRWEPTPEVAIEVPAVLSVDDRFPFSGRSEEMADIAAALEAAWGGQRQIVALAGEPGVGKTRLAAEAIRRMLHLGGVVGVGVCDEDVQGPYQPVVDALSGLLGAQAEVAAEVRARYGAALDVLMGSSTPDGAAAVTLERHQLFADVARIVRAVAAAAPVCLLIDDLQWATPDTLALVRHLIRETGSDRVLLLLTYRDSDVSQEHPLFPFLADLHRVPGASHVRLGGLSVDEVVQLASAAAGQELGPDELRLAHRIHGESAGSPFFVTELLLHLVQSGSVVNIDGRWAVGDGDTAVDLPLSVRDVVLRRVGRLSAEAQRVLRLAAVAGYTFELDVVLSVADLDEESTLELVESAVAADLVEEVGPDRFRFRHRLTRDTLYQQLSATRRARLHRRVAEGIESVRAERVEDLAYHWSEATGLSDASRVARYCRLAGDRAAHRRALADARRFYRRAIDALQLAGGDNEATTCDVLLTLGQVERDLGDGAARATLDEAVRLARRLGDHSRLATSVLSALRAGGFCTEVGREDTELLALIDEILPSAGGVDRARLLAARAAERHWSAPPEQLRADSDEAMALVRDGHDPRATVEVLLARCFALAGPDHTAERVQWGAEAVTRARELGSVELEAAARLVVLCARYELGDVTCLDDVEDLERLDGDAANGFTSYAVALLRAMRLIAIDPGRGEEAALAAYELGESSSQPEAMEGLSVQLGDVFSHTGRTAEIVELYCEAVEARPALLSLRAGFAKVLAEVDRLDDAKHELDLVAATWETSHRDMAWLAHLIDSTLVAARVGTPEQQHCLYDLLLPFADRQAIAVWFLVVEGSVQRYLGLLAEALGRYDDAVAHFEAALDQDRRFGHDVFVAAAERDLARVRATASPPLTGPASTGPATGTRRQTGTAPL